MSHTPRPALSRRVITCIVMPALLGLASTSTPAFSAPLNAPAASSFRDSIGVQLHTDFQGIAYQADTTDHMVSAIKGLGIRHVRDRVCMDKPDVCAKVFEKLSAVGDTYGTGGPRVDLIVGVMPNVDAPTDRASRDALIEAGLRQVRDASYASEVAGLEMVNEPDLLKRGDWAAQTVADAKTLHRLLAEPEFASLSHLPVLAPALGRQKLTSALQAAGFTPDLADVPNLHPYPATYSIPEAALDLPCDTTTSILDCSKDLANGSSAPVATESGYSTAGTLLVSDWVTQRAQATYTLRLLLNNFNEGVARTYLYELVDLSPTPTFRNHGYGLMKARLAPDNQTFRFGSPKLAYLALQRMNAIIGDLGANGRPGSLDLALTDPTTGAEVPDSQIERVVLRRADGTYVLALWQRAQSFSFLNYTQRDLTVAPKQVKVQLDGSAGEWTATGYMPTVSADPTVQFSGSSITVPVSDEVTLLSLTPPAALRTPDPTPEPTPVPTPDPAATPVPSPEATATPVPTISPVPGMPGGPVTAPHNDGPHHGEGSQTGGQATPPPVRDPAAVAREKANRRERARIRASRAYAACLDRLVARAQRRTRPGNARPRPSRPTQEMREQCDRSLAR